jgi:hypothetical protein
MNSVSSTTRKRIEAQGYLGLSDSDLAEVGPWLRLAPAMCMVWTGIATFYQSELALMILVPFAALGAILRGHPFETIYNYGIRHIVGTQRLPPAQAPRRFACGVATIYLIVTIIAFHNGFPFVGQFFGFSLVAAAAFPTFTNFCIPSFIYGLIFGKPGSLDPDKGAHSAI